MQDLIKVENKGSHNIVDVCYQHYIKEQLKSAYSTPARFQLIIMTDIQRSCVPIKFGQGKLKIMGHISFSSLLN